MAAVPTPPARARKLPAAFQIGFALPATTGKGIISGYHCWAWFQLPDAAWVSVDISTAWQHPEKRDYYFGHLDADRVAFTTGRELKTLLGSSRRVMVPLLEKLDRDGVTVRDGDKRRLRNDPRSAHLSLHVG